MLTVVDFEQCKNKEGKRFFILLVDGHHIQIQSEFSGLDHSTRVKFLVACSLPEEECRYLVGKHLPGRVKREQVAPYMHKLPYGGQEVKLDFRYSYQPEYASNGCFIALDKNILTVRHGK